MPETTLARTDVRRGTYLTADDLRAWGASCGQVAKVERLWPDGAELTLEALERAAEEDMDVGWLARPLLFRRSLNVFLTAPEKLHAFLAAHESAWSTYRAHAGISAISPRRDYRLALARALWDALPEPDPAPAEVTP